ncbi:hypothetical protein [Edaphocola flava]|uniref:hypothetical protein n=1 Tax=Edaphocola flava TaxID=2499629 RepID=UPI00100AD8C3|nr:hypothetical protein [Edaphocola flava]
MAIYKELIGTELYLYMNGQLIYKRWLNTGASKIFDIIAYDKYTHTSIRDLVYENPNIPYITIKAKLTLFSTKNEGRLTGIISGYRPDHVFEYNDTDAIQQRFIGDICFDNGPVEPGQTKKVWVRFLLNQPIEPYLTIGRKWWILEDSVAIGILEYIA